MGRTIPPFRPALEMEIESWKEFRRGLRPEERIFYDRIMDFARQHADSGSLSARPLISEVIFFSCLIEQQKHIEILRQKIRELEGTLAKITQENEK